MLIDVLLKHVFKKLIIMEILGMEQHIVKVLLSFY